MKDNTDPRRTHSAVCVTVQMTPAAQASSAAEKALWIRHQPLARFELGDRLAPGEAPVTGFLRQALMISWPERVKPIAALCRLARTWCSFEIGDTVSANAIRRAFGW